MPPKRRSLSDRLWSRVNKSGPWRGIALGRCWVWEGPVNWAGYGKIGEGGRGGKILATHRVAFMLANGPIPPGKHVLHRCDYPPCCNPRHLFLGNQRTNMDDMVRKNRQRNKGHPGEDNGRAILTEKEVRAIRTSTLSALELAKRYGVSRDVIYKIRRNVTWKHLEW